jgi:hypothetical protein
LFGIVTVGAVSDAPEPEGRRAGFICGAVMWLVAGLLLQLMPHTEGGVQLVPLFPWQYLGWIVRAVSSVCWLCILFGCLFGISGDTQGLQETAVLMVAVIGLNALLSFAAPVGVTTVNTPPMQSVEDPIAQWEKSKSNRQGTLNRLLSDKEALIARIRNLGAKNKNELMAHPIGHTLVEELEQLCQQIDNAKKEIEVVETAAERAKSHRRTMERQKMLNGGKLTDKQLTHMSAANHILEEEHRNDQTPGIEVQRDKLLDDVFDKER